MVFPVRVSMLRIDGFYQSKGRVETGAGDGLSKPAPAVHLGVCGVIGFRIGRVCVAPQK